MIDLSLSDESHASHAQHEDSSDQDLDEEHRIGGLVIDSGMVYQTSGSQKMSIFRGVGFRPGGSSGIDFHVADHLGNLSRMVSDPPILDWHKDGVYLQVSEAELARKG